MTFKLTDEQQAVEDAVAYGRENLVVNAVAGSGKTTVLAHAANAWQRQFPAGSGLAVAFNKEIAQTLKTKMPSNFQCRTLHSHGFTAWKRWYGHPCEIGKFKDYECLERAIGEEWREQEVQAIKGELRRGLSLVKSMAVDRNSVDFVKLAESLEASLAHQGIFFATKEQTDWAIEAILGGLQDSIDIAMDEGLISFDDMLFMPIYVGADFDQFELVLLDEAQDVSPLQLEMVARSIKKPLGRLIAVGDRNQAIYGWRGADDQSIDNIVERFGCEELPMTYTFRCPQNITREAQKIVPQIQCPDDAPFGSVVENSRETMFRKLESWEPSRMEEIAVVCRNRKPLISLCFALRKRGIKAFVLGSEIAAILTGLIRRWKVKNVLDVERQAQKWKDEQIAEAKSRKAWDAISTIEDKADVIICVCQNMDASLGKREIIDEIRKIFADERRSSEALLLSTIHKAKGLEWPRVIFLNPELLPNKYCQKDWQFQQEDNLRYVAITRALEELIISGEETEDYDEAEDDERTRTEDHEANDGGRDISDDSEHRSPETTEHEGA